jgi:hypothetical protein
MHHASILTWHEANWNFLNAAIALCKQHLLTKLSDDQDALQQAQHQFESANREVPGQTALDQLKQCFGLTDFEQWILLLGVLAEFDSSCATLFSQLLGDPQQTNPTFAIALSAFPKAHWSALKPTRPLRNWHLISLGHTNSLNHSPFRISERILHYLVGEPDLDPQLQPFIKPLQISDQLVTSHQAIADEMTTFWQATSHRIGHLYGNSGLDQKAIASEIARQNQLTLYQLTAPVLSAHVSDLLRFKRLWEREVKLNPSLLLISTEEFDLSHPQSRMLLQQWVEDLQSPVLFLTRDRSLQGLYAHTLLSLEVLPPQHSEQQSIWETELQSADLSFQTAIPALVRQFNLSPTTIRTVCRQSQTATPAEPMIDLWQRCRVQSRPQLDDLAQRIDAISAGRNSAGTATWEDLVLPPAQSQVLKMIAAHVKERHKVYDMWGFGAKNARGLGISAMFAGASGTGKTTAAEVLAHELRLDLYRIDLSAVVSKYIGETEKNLRKIFDAAESGSVILLFDEADALFGKRSEVKDARDRYANVEVAYLLQRMEAFQGLSILTTNLKETLDPAFLRRIRFVVKFPFPEVAQREEIWRRVFPKTVPQEDLHYGKLAKLNIAGGNIRNKCRFSCSR